MFLVDRIHRYSFRPAVFATAVLASFWTACGQKPFSPHRLDSTGGDVSGFLRGLGTIARHPVNRTRHPMAFLAVTSPDGIAAVDMEAGKVVWRQPVSDRDSRLVVGRRNVYYVSKSPVALVALDVTTGRRRWKRPLGVVKGRGVYGMAADGDRVYVVIGQTGTFVPGKWSSYVEAWDGGDGSLRWRREAPGRLGAPSAAGGYVFLPYRQQYLSVLDAGSGKEVLRVRTRKEYVTFVRVLPEGVYFGGNSGAFKLNARAATGLPEKADFLRLDLSRAGKSAGLLSSGRQTGTMRIAYYWDGYEPVMFRYTAYDRNMLLWRGGRGRSFAKHRAVLEYFRYFFGFDTESGMLKWVHIEPEQDVLSSADVGTALLYATKDGQIVSVDPETGDVLWRMKTGLSLVGATFDAEGFSATGRRVSAQNLVDVLKRIVFDPDRRLSVAKLFALTQLRNLKGTEVTQILLHILSDRKLPLSVRLKAEQVLVERVSPESVPLLLAVLHHHFDYVTGERAMAVGPVAMALGKMKVTKAVKALSEHLTDASTPLSTVRKIVTAMAKIGGRSVVDVFRQFLLDYRADAAFKRSLDVLFRVVDVLSTQGGVAERQLLAFVAEDPYSLPQLRNYIGEKLSVHASAGVDSTHKRHR